jgi:hypothetical protein
MMDTLLRTFRRASLRALPASALALALFLVPGCIHTPPGKAPSQLPAPLAAEAPLLRQWDQAMKAFREGDLTTAHNIFERLSHEGTDQRLRQRALFAMACVRLLEAKTPEDYTSALNAWELWKTQYQPDSLCEGPRLLTPVLERLPALQEKARLAEKNKTRPQPSDCPKLLEEKEKEISELRQRLQALESIHREIEEKKKGLKD